MTKISNCGHDERNLYSGGAAGDQTKTEYRICDWYSRPWDCVIRHPKAEVRETIAKMARNAAENDNIGYDQNQRTTFWQELKKTGYNVRAIKTKCEADCSSSTCTIVNGCGHKLGIKKLQDVSVDNWTGSMRSALSKAGFKVLTAGKYTDSCDYLLPGDILLNEQHHVAINVTKGAKA